MTSRTNGPHAGPGGSAAAGAGQIPSSADQLFAMAVAHHQRGQLAEAEGLYRRILAANPRHAESLHYAGVAALQQGRNEHAANLIEQSLSLRERNAEAHYHLGLAMAGLRRFEESAAQNRSAIALKPDYVEAHLNLGNSLKELGRLDEATASYERAIALNPKLAFAHYNLANILVSKGELAVATKSFERALAAQPNFPQAQQDFGVALVMQGRFDEAIQKFNAVLAARPDSFQALMGRAVALIQKGNAHDALGAVCRTLDINPTADAKSLFVDCVKILERYPPVPWLKKHLIAAITEPWGWPRDFAGFAARTVRVAGAVADINAQLAAEGENFKFALSHLQALATDQLLLAVLENVQVTDPQLERTMAAARCGLLELVAANPGATGESLLGFSCALARQCFINEYVFDLSGAEGALARERRDALVASLDGAAAPAPLLLAVVASYFPLHGIAGARSIAHAIMATGCGYAADTAAARAARRAQATRGLAPSHAD
jgi:tetratricopeptide (TPR) repeat protein